MVPGLPFVAVGRNADIAWGGTNLRAASSDLFDVSALPAEAITERTERIDVRWWPDSEVTVRDTPYGPLISDAPVLPHRDGERLALRWIGHRPTDEMSAMLAVNRARDWQEFRQALDGFALSSQNFLYADRQGNISQLTAAQLPARPPTPPTDIVHPLADAAAWDRIVTSAELPSSYNPATGFLASANNRPAAADVLIGYFFSADDRVLRLQQQLGARSDWTVERLRTLQRDAYGRSSILLRDALIQRLETDRMTVARPEEQRVLDLVAAWDGVYAAGSPGALAFEALAAGVVTALYDEATRAILDSGGNLYAFLAEDLLDIETTRLQAAMASALPPAAAALQRYGSWGEAHRLPVQHLLGGLPVIGARYRFADLPAAGSSETILKTAHALTTERHSTRYGAQARHISDLSDPDANWFVLLGGQDGWFNSPSFSDQVEPFMAGELIQVPLTLDKVRASFPHRLDLAP
jgi:penicillin amidase